MDFCSLFSGQADCDLGLEGVVDFEIHLPRIGLVRIINLESTEDFLSVEVKSITALRENLSKSLEFRHLPIPNSNFASLEVIGLASSLQISIRVSGGDAERKMVKVSSTVQGFFLDYNPPSSRLIPLLNICTSMTNHDCDVAAEVHFLTGLALMSARRFVQATEMFRHAEDDLFRLSCDESNKSSIFKRASKIELLAAQGLSQHGHVNDKIRALRRACAFGSETEPGELCADVCAEIKTPLLSMMPQLLHLILENLHEKLVPLRSAATHSLQFVLDHIGCSIGPMFVLTLDTLVETHPLSSTSPPFGEMTPVIIDAYNRLYETCYNLLPFFSNDVLLGAIVDVLQPRVVQLFSAVDPPTSNLPATQSQIFVQLLRFFVVSIRRVKSSVRIRRDFLQTIFRATTYVPEDTTETPVAAPTALNKAALKAWGCLSSFYFSRLGPGFLSEIAAWVAAELSDENERETPVEVGGPKMTLLLALLSQLSAPRSIRHLSIADRASLILTLPPLLSLIRAQTSVANFPVLWDTFTSVLSALPTILKPKFNAVLVPLLDPIFQFSEKSNPPTEMLRVLHIVLSRPFAHTHAHTLPVSEISTAPSECPCRCPCGVSCACPAGCPISCDCGKFWLALLDRFVKWIPHSTADETFDVFDALVAKIVPFGIPSEILVTIIGVLVNKYTVKSATRRKSEIKFIETIMGEDVRVVGTAGGATNESHIQSIIKHCLLENTHALASGETTPRNRDTRHEEILQEQSLEKISFLERCVRHIQHFHFLLISSHLKDIHRCCELLLSSQNSKVRNESMKIMKHFGLKLLCVNWDDALSSHYSSSLPQFEIRRAESECRYFLRSCFVPYFRYGLTVAGDPDLQIQCVLCLHSFFSVLDDSTPNSNHDDSYEVWGDHENTITKFVLCSPAPTRDSHRLIDPSHPHPDSLLPDGEETEEDLFARTSSKIYAYGSSPLDCQRFEWMTDLFASVADVILTPWKNLRLCAMSLLVRFAGFPSTNLTSDGKQKFQILLLKTVGELLESSDTSSRACGLQCLAAHIQTSLVQSAAVSLLSDERVTPKSPAGFGGESPGRGPGPTVDIDMTYDTQSATVKVESTLYSHQVFPECAKAELTNVWRYVIDSRHSPDAEIQSLCERLLVYVPLDLRTATQHRRNTILANSIANLSETISQNDQIKSLFSESALRDFTDENFLMMSLNRDSSGFENPDDFPDDSAEGEADAEIRFVTREHSYAAANNKMKLWESSPYVDLSDIESFEDFVEDISFRLPSATQKQEDGDQPRFELVDEIDEEFMVIEDEAETDETAGTVSSTGTPADDPLDSVSDIEIYEVSGSECLENEPDEEEIFLALRKKEQDRERARRKGPFKRPSDKQRRGARSKNSETLPPAEIFTPPQAPSIFTRTFNDAIDRQTNPDDLASPHFPTSAASESRQEYHPPTSRASAGAQRPRTATSRIQKSNFARSLDAASRAVEIPTDGPPSDNEITESSVDSAGDTGDDADVSFESESTCEPSAYTTPLTTNSRGFASPPQTDETRSQFDSPAAAQSPEDTQSDSSQGDNIHIFLQTQQQDEDVDVLHLNMVGTTNGFSIDTSLVVSASRNPEVRNAWN